MASSPSRATRTKFCEGTCTNVATDPENCGKCGTLCPSGQACVAGACSATCPPDDKLCTNDGGASICVNAQTDNDNCGSCGHACKPNEICHNAECNGTCGDSKSGEVVCGADGGLPYCANLQADNTNCGTCGHVCTGGELCVSGVCKGACDTSQTLCGIDAGSPYCADLQTDNANCGACGAPCGGSLKACVAGACQNLCTGQQITCPGDAGSYCVDNQSDNLNCGTCGNVCPNAKPICSGGTCTSGGGGGTVRYTSGTIANIVYAKCGNGTNTNCTEPVAETSCTSIGRKLVSHASNGTSAVVSLGATSSCYFSISYFTNNDPSVAGQCLIGVSNAIWTSCCGTTSWHGNTVSVPATLGTQFGYIYSADSGYNVNLTNTTGTTWGCQPNSSAAAAHTGCTTYYVACL